MPKLRQVRFLHWRRLADGREVGVWKPSPELRRAGWATRQLGDRTQELAVLAAAIELNARLDAWRARGRQSDAIPAAPRKLRFEDLLAAYRQGEDYARLAQKTRDEYEVRLRQLETWAMDGQLPLDQLDGDMIRDLRKALVRDATPHKTAATLRVLRVLVNFAVDEKLLPRPPVHRWRIPEPPSRSRVLDPLHEVEAARAVALERGWPSVALALRLGLWSLQREADLLAANRLSWRLLEDVAPADRAVLANPRGEVFGLWLRQRKTGAWIVAPVPPQYHAEVDAMFAATADLPGQPLLVDDTPSRGGKRGPLNPWLLQRRVRACYAAAGVADAQFRDLRRSGMTMFASNGAKLDEITAVSGHTVLGRRKTILDTYMPPNVEKACRAVATVLRTQAAIAAREADQQEHADG
jgi:hypothetical protein